MVDINNLDFRLTQLEYQMREQYSNFTIDNKLKELEDRLDQSKSSLQYSIIKPKPLFLTTSTNTYFGIPVKSKDIKLSRGGCISIDEPNKVVINTSGTYQITMNLTVEVPEGSVRYEVGLFKNDKLEESLSRGYVTSNEPTWFSISGSSVLNLTEKDVVELKYMFNSGKTLAVKSVTLSFIKL